MSFLNLADIAEASSFQRRMLPAIAQVAGNVLSEEPTGKWNVDTKRNELARLALRDPGLIAKQFVWAVLSNVTIAQKGLDATDGELVYQITQSWSTIAGVTALDEQETPIVVPPVEPDPIPNPE